MSEAVGSHQLRVRPDGTGVSFEVLVVPRASRSRVIGGHGGALKLTLAAAPVDGEANAELCALLAKSLGVPRAAVRVTRGPSSRHKTIHVDGIDSGAVQALCHSER
jgi:uncharacterized protein (TIGR00251 family)